MATVNQLIETILDTIEGTKRGDLGLRARLLREAGYLPTGKRGGGRGLAHVNSEHCANLIIGLLASTSARGVVPLVKQFRDLPLLRTEAVDIVGSTPIEDKGEPATPLIAIRNMIDLWRADIQPWAADVVLAEMIGYCDRPEGPVIFNYKDLEQDDEGKLMGWRLIYGADPDLPQRPHWAPMLSLSMEVIQGVVGLLGKIEDATA